MTPWVVVVTVGTGTWLLRVSMLVVAARFGLPPIAARVARHAVAVSFAALATTALVDRAAVAPAAPIAALAAAVIAVRRTGSPHAAILAGMPTAWAMAAIVGR